MCSMSDIEAERPLKSLLHYQEMVIGFIKIITNRFVTKIFSSSYCLTQIQV